MATSSPSRPPSAAEQQLAAQIEARHAQLSRKDHFLTLGITPTATKDQIKSAFLNLAKTFHPESDNDVRKGEQRRVERASHPRNKK